MTRRREGWPILTPEGWATMTDAERRQWWDDIWQGRSRPEFLVAPKGRPDVRRWAGSLVARRVVITCRWCGALLAKVDDYEHRIVQSVGQEHRSGYGMPLTCPEHGRVPAPVSVVKPALEEARQSGRVVRLEITPSC